MTNKELISKTLAIKMLNTVQEYELIKRGQSKVFKTVEEFKNQWDDPNLLHIKQFPGGEMDVNGIRSFVAQLELRKWKPKLIIIDYVGEMKDDNSVAKHESAYRILRDLRGWGVERHGRRPVGGGGGP